MLFWKTVEINFKPWEVLSTVYNNILILSVYLCIFVTGYKLGLWRAHRHETGVIRTSMIWKEDIKWKICWKATGDGIIEKNYTNAFLWRKFYHNLFLSLKSNYLEGSHTNIWKNRFFEKRLRHLYFSMGEVLFWMTQRYRAAIKVLYFHVLWTGQLSSI